MVVFLGAGAVGISLGGRRESDLRQMFFCGLGPLRSQSEGPFSSFVTYTGCMFCCFLVGPQEFSKCRILCNLAWKFSKY